MSLLKSSRPLLGATRLSQLISKRGNKNFYKGRGGKKFGQPDKHGKFKFNTKQFHQNSFRAPDLEGFQLKAYVARDTPKVTVSYLRSKLMEKMPDPPAAENAVPADESAKQ